MSGLELWLWIERFNLQARNFFVDLLYYANVPISELIGDFADIGGLLGSILQAFGDPSILDLMFGSLALLVGVTLVNWFKNLFR